MISQRIAIFSDLHVHSFTSYASLTKEGYNSRLVGILRALELIAQQCKDMGIITILFAGDMFHVRKLDVEVYDLLYQRMEKIKEAGITCVMIPGNHDQALRHQDCHSVRPLGRVGHLLDDMEQVQVGPAGYRDVVVQGCGYRRNKQDIVKLQSPEAKPDILLLHCGVVGSMASCFYLSESGEDTFTYDELVKLSNGARLIVCGHFHAPQLLTDGGKVSFQTSYRTSGPTVLIPGSPLHHSFSDDGPRGFWVYDPRRQPGEKHPDLEFHPLDLPRFVKATYGKDKLNGLKGHYVHLKVPSDLSHSNSTELQELLASSTEGFSIEYEEPIKGSPKARTELSPTMSFGNMVDTYLQHIKKTAENVPEWLDWKSLGEKGLGYIVRAQEDQ